MAVLGGISTYLWWVAGGLVLLLVIAYAAAVFSLPRDFETEVVADSDLTQLTRNGIEAMQEQGFERQGPAVKVLISLKPVMVPMVHRQLQSFGVVYEIPAMQGKRLYDIVTLFTLKDTGLTSSSIRDGGNAPTWLGGFRQIFPNRLPDHLVEQHRAAMQKLAEHGLQPKPLDEAGLMSAVRDSFRLQRQVYMKSPVVSVFRTMWRVLSRRNPHLVPIVEQQLASEQLRAIQTGLWPEPEKQDAPRKAALSPQQSTAAADAQQS